MVKKEKIKFLINLLFTQLMEIATNDFEAIRLGQRGREDALKRHCKERIVTDLLSIYKEIKNGKYIAEIV
jgi:hypothetical protein